MSIGASESNPIEPGREEERASPDPQRLIRNVEKRTERDLRQHFGDLHKYVIRGAAMGAGKKAFEEFLDLLTGN